MAHPHVLLIWKSFPPGLFHIPPIKTKFRHRESLKGIEKKVDQPDNGRVVDLVIHSNKQTGPLWRIHKNTFRTFQFTRNFAIWQIVTQASLNLDRFYSTCILAAIQYFKFWKCAMMDQFVTLHEKGLLARKDKK